MQKKAAKIISLVLAVMMIASTMPMVVWADGTFTYMESVIKADASGTSVLGVRTNDTRALDPTDKIVELGEEYPSYGRTEGEKVYHWENAVKDTNYMAWTHGGLKSAKHDQAGEFNVRLHNGAYLSLQENMPGNHLVRILSNDNYWHHVSYAYNYEKGRLVVWVDGKMFSEMTKNTKSNGLYLRSRTEAANAPGTICEIDDVRAYALDEASSCKVTYKEDGTTVQTYDSFEKIVADKVDLTPVLKSGDIIKSINITSDANSLNVVKVESNETTCADVIDEALYGENNYGNITSARIFNADFSVEYTEEEPAIGKILVVEGKNKLGNNVVSTYSIDNMFVFASPAVYSEADGNTTAFGTNGSGNYIRAFAPDTANKQNGFVATTGNDYNGYGKADGENIYRWEGLAKDANMMAWGHSALRNAKHDQVGEFNFRTHGGTSLLIQNNQVSVRAAAATMGDNYWHHLTYAYNSAADAITVWVDGVKLVTTGYKGQPSNGLYFRSNTVMPEGGAIEIDNIRAWALDEASSGAVTYKEDGTTVASYDSYNVITGRYLDNFIPTVSVGGVISSIGDGNVKLTAKANCAQLIAAAKSCEGITDAKVFDTSFLNSYAGSEMAADKVLVVYGINKNGTPVMNYYDIFSGYSYAGEVYSEADSSTTKLGTDGSGNYIRAFAPDTANKQNGFVAQAGITHNGYGKTDEDNFYRWEGPMAKDTNLMAWGHSALRTAKHDQVGEFNIRTQGNGDLLLLNNQVGVRAAGITFEDDYWHHVSYAYNSAKDVITVWIDGKVHISTKYNGAMPNGIYLRTRAAMAAGDAIEIDNLRAWALDENSSGLVSYEEDGTTVASYDSYDVIANAHLDHFVPEVSANGAITAVDGDNVKLAMNATCAQVISAAKACEGIIDAKIFDPEFDGETASDKPAEENILVVYGVNKNGSSVMNYYKLVGGFAYLAEINASGKVDDYFGTVTNDARALDRDYAIVTVSEEIPGSGKANGEAFYRFTKDSADVVAQTPAPGSAAACNLMAWAYVDSTKTFHDQTGSFSFRMSDNAPAFTVYANGAGYADLLYVNNPDNQWHKLTYAYNAAKKEINFWIDGVHKKTVSNCSTYGLYLRLYQSNKETDYRMLEEGEFIDFDDIKAYTLDNQSSGITSGSESETIYESYDKLISDKLDLVFPAEIESTGEILASGDMLAFLGEAKAADIVALHSGKAAVYDSSLAAVVSDSSVVENGMYLVIEENGAFRYYELGKYKNAGKIWVKDVETVKDSHYVISIANPGKEAVNVLAYTVKSGTGTVCDRNLVSFPAGAIKKMGLGKLSEEELSFYLWNESLAPYCAPIEK